MEHCCCREIEGKLSHYPKGRPDSSNQGFIFVSGPVIVGAGPTGLAVAACLKEKVVESVVLERSDCIASLWQRKTYDRLRLHLPRRFCELPLPSGLAVAACLKEKVVESVVLERSNCIASLWQRKTYDSGYTSRGGSVSSPLWGSPRTSLSTPTRGSSSSISRPMPSGLAYDRGLRKRLSKRSTTLSPGSGACGVCRQR